MASLNFSENPTTFSESFKTSASRSCSNLNLSWVSHCIQVRTIILGSNGITGFHTFRRKTMSFSHGSTGGRVRENPRLEFLAEVEFEVVIAHVFESILVPSSPSQESSYIEFSPSVGIRLWKPFWEALEWSNCTACSSCWYPDYGKLRSNIK